MIAGSSPQVEVEVEIDDGHPQNQKDKLSAADEKEKEAVDGLFDPQPPVGILKKSDYVSGKEEEAESHLEDEKQGKKKTKKARRKLVPVWRLVTAATLLMYTIMYRLFLVSICQLLGYFDDNLWDGDGYCGRCGPAWTYASLWAGHQ